MAYDAAAKKVAIKAIGTVETGMRYDLINYADPITVGLTQWYGGRAYNILKRMRDENPSKWTGVAASLVSDMDSHTNPNWWPGRYLTRDEGATLKPVLLNNKAIQDDQTIKDLEDYVSIAERWGMDKDANTKAMIFFFVMYHQSPRRAKNVLNSAGSESSMARLRSFCLNEPVLGKYKNRYNTAYNIINSMDSSGVDDPPQSSGEDSEGGDNNDEFWALDPGQNNGGSGRAGTGIKYLQVNGDEIRMVTADGGVVIARPNGNGLYLPVKGGGVGTPNAPDDSGQSGEDNSTPPDTETDSGESSGDMPENLRQDALKVIAWTKARVGRYKYSQAPGRLDPDKNGYTDCSGLLRTAYLRVLGIETGTYTGGTGYTGGMRAVGRAVTPLSSGRVDESKLWLGDLFLMHHTNGVGHVEMYIGNGKVIGHGGVPYMGPTIKNLQEVATRQKDWIFRRYLK